MRSPWEGHHFFHIEHEDLLLAFTNGSWLTDAMLRSSAKLVAYLCTTYGIPVNRDHILSHVEINAKSNLGGHGDPGPFWPWDRYMKLVREYAGGQAPPEPNSLLWVNAVASKNAAYGKKVATAFTSVLKRAGFRTIAVTENVVKAVDDALDGVTGNHPAIIFGDNTYNEIPQAARRIIHNSDGSWKDPTKIDVWDVTGSRDVMRTKARWRLKEICDRKGLPPLPVLEAFETQLVPIIPQPIFTPGPDLKSEHSRGVYDLVGAERYSAAKLKAWARTHKPHERAYQMCDAIHKVVGEAWRANGNPVYAADVAFVQYCHETGFGHYGGDSRPHNPAGIKKARASGDTTADFEVPATPYEGARMLINHMSVYIGGKPYGTPHGRYNDIKPIRWNSARTVDQLTGTWAMDPGYATKMRKYLAELEGVTPEDDLVALTKQAMELGMQLLGISYGSGWKAGTWPDGPSLYARCNPKVHTIQYIREHEIICSAYINVIRAHVAGLPALGRNQGDPWPGGTAAVGRTLAKMKGARRYKPGEIVPYGSLLHAPYLGEALHLQGHECLSLGNGKVLEARPPFSSSNRTALEVHRTLLSIAGQGITDVIPSSLWLRL